MNEAVYYLLAVALLLIAFGPILPRGKDVKLPSLTKPRVALHFLAGALALAILLHEKAIEIVFPIAGGIKLKAEQAALDAAQISELRERLESKVSALEKTVADAQARAKEMDRGLEFTRTVAAAQLGDRKAFDQLETWGTDQSCMWAHESNLAYLGIVQELQERGVAIGQPKWPDGVDPKSLGIKELREIYATLDSKNTWQKIALIFNVSRRKNLPEIDKLSFWADIVEKDECLPAVVRAGRDLAKGLGLEDAPFSVRTLLSAWNKKRDTTLK